MTGALVAGLHRLIFEMAWSTVRDVYTAKPWVVFILPPAGFLLAAVLVRGLTANRYSHGTEEVLIAYHTPGTQIRSLPFLRRSAGSLATIGTGGSAGLEGAAIYAGSWFASYFVRHIKFWQFDEEDRRVLLLVGAAAGVAAVFRAPLTGLLFSLEVPYKGDVAKNAFVPGLLASATSYFTFASILTPEPIFSFKATESFDVTDLSWVLLIGLICGVLAWTFVTANRAVRRLFRNPRVPWEVGALSGGLIVGALGFISLRLYGTPLSMGPGYETVLPELFTGQLGLQLLLALLGLKVAATIFTLGTYGIGGIFFQSFLIGGIAASCLAAALDLGSPNLLIAAGMASFLAAVYKTPIAATTFVAEATASPSYVVPAFIAAAVSFVVSGNKSISENQVPYPRVRYDALQGLRVRDAMQTGVVTVPSQLTIEQFLNDWVLRYRHIAYPVTNQGQLVGWITLEHASAFPPDARKLATVQDGMNKQVPTCNPNEPLLEALRRMQHSGTSRFLVVDPAAPNRMVGILAEPDILRLVELRASLQE